MTVGVGLAAIPAITDAGYGAVVASPYHNLREAVLPLVQRTYDGDSRGTPDFAVVRLRGVHAPEFRHRRGAGGLALTEPRREVAVPGG